MKHIGASHALAALYYSVSKYLEKIVTPGLINQHTHITGVGGKHGFASITPEIILK